MLGSVQDDRYEGLRNYIVGNKRPPTNVPFVSVHPRMEKRPGEQTPGAEGAYGRIPTSSQRPGKRTNDTIPYARVCFTEFHDSAADPSDVFPGDVVMLHRTSKALGHDNNRPTKVASWRQINAMLARGTSGVLLDGSNASEVLNVRRRELRGIMSTLQSAEVEAYHLANRSSPPRPNIELQQSITRMNIYYEELRGETVELEEGRQTVFLPHVDWKAVTFLSDWSPDGILMSRDDDEQSASFFATGPGESGIVFNVAVQGPASVRNGDDLSQAFDPDPRVMDFLYMLLVCNEVLDASGAFNGFSFRLKPTSGRLLEVCTVRSNSSNTDAFFALYRHLQDHV